MIRCIKSVNSQNTNYKIMHNYMLFQSIIGILTMVIINLDQSFLGVCFLDIDNKLTSDHIEKNMKCYFETQNRGYYI